MQRERWNTAAAPRDRPVGEAVGTKVGRAVASEENCARFNESQGVDKEPVPLTTGMTHEYNSDFPPEDHVRFRRVRNRRVWSVYERGNALPCLFFAPNRPRSDGHETLRRVLLVQHRLVAFFIPRHHALPGMPRGPPFWARARAACPPALHPTH